METLHGEPSAEPSSDWYSRTLASNERVTIDPDWPPLLEADECQGQFGIGAPLRLMVGASPRKRFYVFDLLHGPDPSYFVRSDRVYGADFLLADDLAFKPSAHNGYTGIRHADSWVTVGRLYLTDRFSYPLDVSRHHFSICCDGARRLYVRNFDPLNQTALCLRRRS